MLNALILMGGLGVVTGGILAIASKLFYVYVDPKVEAIDEALPGANCGGCGYPGCSANAQAIADGKSGVDSCVAAGADVAIAIAGIMGVSVSEKEIEYASPGCYYPMNKTMIKYNYDGIGDCRAANLLFGGMKECSIGCLGLGTCVDACLFGALSMGDDMLPKVDEEKCTGCGACEKACPKNMIALTSASRRIIREYTEDECITPCQRACPVGIDIREYIRCVKTGDNIKAVQKIKERNPFPSVIGRICPAFCEMECRRQLADEPVAINDLKRFVCDLERENKNRVIPYKAPATEKKIAIIGGGVEGLSAAYFCARLGHEPIVMEATDVLGGLLRIAIPEERLPLDVLDYDIEGILEAGVKVKTNYKSGLDFTIPDLLKDGFKAVFIASGGWDHRVARGDINEVANVFPGGSLLIDLLRSDMDNISGLSYGKNVVIAEGGGVISDAVDILKNNGVHNIIIILRNSIDNCPLDKAMIEKLENLGVSFVFDSEIEKVSGQDELLTQIEYKELATGKTHILDADNLIIGAGRFPEFCFVNSDRCDDNENLEVLKWEGIKIYNIFSNDDLISDYSAAIAAINGGRKASVLIHYLINNIPFELPLNVLTGKSIIQQVDALEQVHIRPRNIMPVADGGLEYYSGFSQDTAIKEAQRCLRCGVICYEIH